MSHMQMIQPLLCMINKREKEVHCKIQFANNFYFQPFFFSLFVEDMWQSFHRFFFFQNLRRKTVDEFKLKDQFDLLCWNNIF